MIIVILAFEGQGTSRTEKEKEVSKGILFMIHVLNYKVFIGAYRILEAS